LLRIRNVSEVVRIVPRAVVEFAADYEILQAKERYESDCLKLNSYTANSQLVQGKELDKLQSKLDRVRQTIGADEQDFRQFVRVLEGTQSKWEQEWKAFCDVRGRTCGRSKDEVLTWFGVARTGCRGRSYGDDEGYHLGVCECCVPGVRGG